MEWRAPIGRPKCCTLIGRRDGPPARGDSSAARRAAHTPALSSSTRLLAPMAPPKKADKKPAQKTAKTAAKKGSKKRAKVSRPV